MKTNKINPFVAVSLPLNITAYQLSLNDAFNAGVETSKEFLATQDKLKSNAYDMIDRFLRNNLDDTDYASYSVALDCIYTNEHSKTETLYQPAVEEAVELLKSLGYVYQKTPKGLTWVNQQNNGNFVAGYFYTNDNGCYIECDPKHQGEKDVVALYTKPQHEKNREWVGLTDDETFEEASKEEQSNGFIQGSSWAEQKLKEKNNG